MIMIVNLDTTNSVQLNELELAKRLYSLPFPHYDYGCKDINGSPTVKVIAKAGRYFITEYLLNMVAPTKGYRKSKDGRSLDSFECLIDYSKYRFVVWCIGNGACEPCTYFSDKDKAMDYLKEEMESPYYREEMANELS